MASIDISALISEIRDTVSGIVGKDVRTIGGYAEGRLKMLATQAQMVAEGIANGSITEETHDFFLESLKEDARNFARTLQGLALITIEKVWNAVVGVLWKAISSVTGIPLALA
jgi:hypothetical protein